MSNIKLYRTVAQAMLAIGFAAGLASIAAAAQINPGGSPPPPPPPPQPESTTFGMGVRGNKVEMEDKTRGLKPRKKADKGGAKTEKDSNQKPK